MPPLWAIMSEGTLWKCDITTFYVRVADLPPNGAFVIPDSSLSAVEERHSHREDKLSLVTKCNSKKETFSPSRGSLVYKLNLRLSGTAPSH